MSKPAESNPACPSAAPGPALTANPALDATLASAVRWVVPCATLPLLFGVIAFAGWFVSYWRFHYSAERLFIVMGVGAVAVGCLAMLLGGTVLIGRISQARTLAADGERRRVIMHTGFLGTLLVINFPLAFFMGVVAIGAFPSAVIHLDNQTGVTITDITVHDGETHELGNSLGQRITRFRFRPNEQLEKVTGKINDVETLLVAADDFQPISGGPRIRVLVTNDGAVNVEAHSAMGGD